MPECGYCRNCKWWEDHTDWQRRFELVGEWGECREDAERQLCIAIDDSAGFNGVLLTHADFGCVLWEPKP